MNCRNCGNELTQGAKFCTACGTAVEAVPVEPVAPVVPPAPAPTPVAAPYMPPVSIPTYAEPPKQKITEADLPEHLRPMSPWAYFGLSILYAIPIVGFIFLIIFSISRANINRRNFTRSYWCSLIIIGAVIATLSVIAIAAQASMW